jgi:glutathionyl-hydroquinone reductase
MGELIDGRWCRTTLESTISSGTVQRKPSIFRRWVTADGAPINGTPSFPAQAAGRYHLYVSLACPWAHRTLIMRGACQPKLWLNTATALSSSPVPVAANRSAASSMNSLTKGETCRLLGYTA